MVYVNYRLDEMVAEMPIVQAKVRSEANQAEGRIKRIVAQHNHSGRLYNSFSVRRNPGNNKDWLVVTTDPRALSKNYGHRKRGGTGWVEGIHFMERGAYGF